MDLAQAEPFLAARHQAMLITQRRNGHAQSSNIVYDWRGGVARISLTESRAKTKNARRNPLVSLHVNSDDFWEYVVVEGTAELSPVTTAPGDAAGLLLAEVYEAVSGSPHPNWDEFHEAMVAEQRLVLTVRPTHVYGQLQG